MYDFYHAKNNILDDHLSEDQKRLSRYSILRTNPASINHELFNKAMSIDKLYQTLDHPVNYKNTKQWVMYLSLNGEKPIFDLYHEK